MRGEQRRYFLSILSFIHFFMLTSAHRCEGKKMCKAQQTRHFWIGNENTEEEERKEEGELIWSFLLAHDAY